MKNILKILMFGLLLLNSAAHSAEFYGGYNTAAIARETLNLLNAKQIITAEEVESFSSMLTANNADPMAGGPDIANLYAGLGIFLIQKGLLNEAEVIDNDLRARKSGGLKVGGINLLFLETGFLETLAKNNVISMDEAQQILDNAR